MMYQKIQAVLLVAVLLCGMLLIPGICGASSETAEGADVTVAGWHIAVEGLQLNDSPANISVALGYTSVETTEYSKQAAEGMTFCMIKLLIEKDGSRETVEWEKMLLTDEAGNEYHRIEDEFILDLGMKRMPGTKLNFGSNEGWIAYEIPKEAAGLAISYGFENETWRFSLDDYEEAKETEAQ